MSGYKEKSVSRSYQIEWYQDGTRQLSERMTKTLAFSEALKLLDTANNIRILVTDDNGERVIQVENA